MLDWIGNAVNKFTDWFSDGTASAVEWLLGGLSDTVTIIIDAADGIWKVFDALWTLGSSFVSSIFSLFNIVFPFLPEPVLNVFSAGLIAVLIAGIVRVVRR